jgi:hypothetical protein
MASLARSWIPGGTSDPSGVAAKSCGRTSRIAAIVVNTVFVFI